MALKAGQGLAQWELATARKLVSEGQRRSRILEDLEFDDLVQDCLLHWTVVRKKVDVDSDSPPLAYMAQTLRNWLADLVRERSSDKRAGDLNQVSLDASIDGTEDGETLAERLEATQLSDAATDDPGISLMRLDLMRACAGLTPTQQRLCLLLGEEGQSVKAAAEQLGIARSTVYEEIGRVRKILVEHGMEIYLKG